MSEVPLQRQRGGVIKGTCAATSPHRGCKLYFSISLIRTTRRQIPASAVTNPGAEREGLIVVGQVLSSSSSLLSSLELSDTTAYEP